MPNPNVITIVHSSYDLATSYLSAYTTLIIEEATKLGYATIDLSDQNATLDNLLNTLTSYDPLLVFINGHGNEELVTGYTGQTLLQACLNDDLMQTRIGSFIACSSGAKLGPSMVDKTASAFLGYHSDFIFIVKPGYESRPLEDPYARSFFEPAITPATSLLNGRTLREAYEDTIARWNQSIREWWSSPDPYASEILTYLFWDRDAFIVITPEGLYARAPTQNTLPLLVFPLAFLAFIAKS